MPKKSISEKMIKKISVDDLPENIVAPKKSLQDIAKALNKKVDSAKIGTKSDPVERIPTNVLQLDYILSGGLPKGRISFLVGQEGSWKSTLCLRAIASIQKSGGTAAYIDAEHGFDGEWAQAHGVDLEQLLLIDPKTAEIAYDAMTMCILEGVDIIVLDSLNTLSVKKEMYDGDKVLEAASIEKNVMGDAQKKTSQWLRNNLGRIAAAKTTFLVIGQLRDNLDMFGPKEVIVGGRAIKFASSLILKTKKEKGKESEIRDENEEVVAIKFNVGIEKNRLGRERLHCSFFAFGSLVDNYESMLEIGLKEGFITRIDNTKYGWEDRIFETIKANKAAKTEGVSAKSLVIEALYKNTDGMYDKCLKQLYTIMGTRIFKYDPYAKQQNITAAQSVSTGELPEDFEGIDDPENSD